MKLLRAKHFEDPRPRYRRFQRLHRDQLPAAGQAQSSTTIHTPTKPDRN